MKELSVSVIRRLRNFYNTLLSKYYSSKITAGTGRIIFTSPLVKLKIIKRENSRLIVNGNLRIESHLGGRSTINIFLSKNSELIIDNDFSIGQGVTISVSENAKLYIGGKSKEKASGITKDSTIMVFKNVQIGADFLCAWDVFISDSDWHSIEGQFHHGPVIIEDHVWVAHSTSILKNTKIGEGSIVASHSKLINKNFPGASLIAGTPARVLKENVKWSKEIS